MTSHLSRRTVAVALAAAVTATVLAGCGSAGARLTYHDTERVKVTEIVIAGSSGDVLVQTAAIEETRISRIVHSDADHRPTYRIEGTALHVDTDCGPDCRVSYQIEAPTGVAVRGQLRSGDVGLTGVASAELKLTSGDVMIDGSTGPVQVTTTSGDITVTDAKGGATLHATSGNVRAMDVGGGPVSARVRSGEVTVKMTTVGSVSAHATSGDVEVLVPAGSYRFDVNSNSGDLDVVGLHNDPSSKNVLDIRTASGDATVSVVPAG